MVPKQLQQEQFKFVKIAKGGKVPIGSAWQKNGYTWQEADAWAEQGNNYGIIGGHGGLIIIDADKDELVAHIERHLPKTFTVQTGRTQGTGKHFYYFCPKIQKKIVLSSSIQPALVTEKEKKAGAPYHYGEIISNNTQVVGAGSLHPSGGVYRIVVDEPIATLHEHDIRKRLADYFPVQRGGIYDAIPQQQGYASVDDFSALSVTSILKQRGWSPSIIGREASGSHPIHGSENGGNFFVNIEKNLWHCFRCDSGGGPLQLIAVLEGIISCSDAVSGVLRGDQFKNAKEIAHRKYGLPITTQSLGKNIQKYPVAQEQEKHMVFRTHEEMLGMKIPEDVWVVDRLVYKEGITMLSAPAGHYKTFLMLHMVLAIASGKPFLNQFKTEQMNVLYINEENRETTLADRLQRFPETNTLPIFFLSLQGIKFPDYTQRIITFCKEKNIRLIVLDSLIRVHSFGENESKDTNKLYEEMKKILVSSITIVMIHHDRKQSLIDKTLINPGEKARGNSDLVAMLDSQLIITKAQDRVFYIEQTKNRNSELVPKFLVELKKEGEKQFFVKTDMVPIGSREDIFLQNQILALLEKNTELSRTEFRAYLSQAGRNKIDESLALLVSQEKIIKKTIERGKILYLINQENEDVHKLAF